MAEPKTRADRIESVRPWLVSWGVDDDRLGGHRSVAHALETADGWVWIDSVPLDPTLQKDLPQPLGLFLTHGNHQRSAWRLRRELGAPVFAPAAASGLDEQADVLIDDRTELPGGLRAVGSDGFQDARFLVFTHEDGTRVAFIGDLLVREDDGSFRFPEQPGYVERAGAERDARRLLELEPTVLCSAHFAPVTDGAREALDSALS